MKSILVFRHIEFESLGFIEILFNERNIPTTLIEVDKGEKIPDSLEQAAGLVVLGGPMSVNDDLPWILPELELIRKARKIGLPILGHCLGAQMISKALGGEVTKNPVKEIGWFAVAPADSVAARSVFGNLGTFEAFHWHGETFSIPDGASPILSSRWCAYQGFVLDNTLAFQCHFEITESMLPVWTAAYRNEIAEAAPSIQTEEQMMKEASYKMVAMHSALRPVYNKWIDRIF